MVIPDMVGHQCILIPYTLSTGDIQEISVHKTCVDKRLYDNAGSSKAIV